MPAAAVIPAPIAYMNVVAVKTLVVDTIELGPIAGGERNQIYGIRRHFCVLGRQ